MDPLFDVFSLEGLDRLVVCTIVGVLPLCPSFDHANHLVSHLVFTGYIGRAPSI